MRDRVWVFAGAPPLLQHRLLLSPFVQTKFFVDGDRQAAGDGLKKAKKVPDIFCKLKNLF
jgi:hypothetical protein